MKRKIQITLIGDNIEIDLNNRIAYEIGKFIAAKGWILITGGRGGVMSAASRGAFENGGIVISVLPGDSINSGTPYATATIATGIGYARNSVNALSGDIVVAIGGGAGTLTEMAYAWAYNKPIIACSMAIGWSKLLAGKAIDNKRNDKIEKAKSIEEVKRLLEYYAKKL